MNLAISSLIIFIIVSPAILARRIYFTKELSKSFVSRNTLQEIFSSIFLSFVLHFLWSGFVELIGYKIDYEIIFQLLFNPQAISDYSNITDSIYNIFSYFISLALISTLFGFIIRNVVRVYKLDRKSTLLRYDNTWYYIFSGEVLDIEKYNKNKTVTSDNIEQRIVDVLTKSDEKYVLYRGSLIDYQLNDSNSVDFIVLASPRKQIIGEDKTKDISSNYFVIPYSEVLNINIKYLEVDVENTETVE
ncbi:hypothetical protein [Flavobacterium sp.]|uniref:hypothetical protein n=1 Tax=Flavobacterium sp. TaxID=239 RepID=UPI0040477491